jgi:hypothetical protein
VVDPPVNPISPPSDPAVLSIDPGPPPPINPPAVVSPPDPNAVPGPLGIVGLAIAAGVFGVRRLVRRKPAAE